MNKGAVVNECFPQKKLMDHSFLLLGETCSGENPLQPLYLSIS